MPKYIVIPAAVPTLNEEGRSGPPLGFAAFVRGVLNDRSFQQSYDTLKSAAAIDRAADGVGGVMTLEPSDWQALERAVKAPTGGFALPARLMIQLLPFIDAIIGASDKEPTP